MAEVQSVVHQSVAERAGVRAGWRLLRIDGEPVGDILDYRMACADTKLNMVFESDSEEVEIVIHKEYDQDPGLVFTTPTLDRVRTCANHCAFCFVDQMPPGLRPSLYVKDDDYRLSFLSGSYITLGNLSDRDIERIIAMKLSPLYVSVHAYDRNVRRRLLCFPQRIDFWQVFDRLLAGGIEIYCQLVLCPDWNDGRVLDETMDELARRRPGVVSVTIVPVGLTRFRERLTALRPFSSGEALAVIESVERWSDEARRERCGTWVWASDEFYLIAERQDLIPAAEAYEEYRHLENGVGMIRLLWQEWQERLPLPVPKTLQPVSLITSVSGAKALQPLLDALKERMEIDMRVIVNRFFGPSVTVTGLLSGADIMDQLPPESVAGRLLLLPDVVLREGSELLIDDVTLTELKAWYRRCSVELRAIEASAAGLFKTLFPTQAKARRRLARRI